MPIIPPFLLKKLYVKGSLRAEDDGFAFGLENPIASGTILSFKALDLDGEGVSLEQVTVVTEEGRVRPATSITNEDPLSFPVGDTFTVRASESPLESGFHELTIRVVVQDVGPLSIPVADQVG
ncbi:MAG: hypothetical protein PVH62_05380 [Anaerolineae bacterium]|jgi:hydroxymethylglutaryl-CoA reductase (NADPH)